ncbi:histidine kinase-like ATPase [Pholiota molesta]|nr:histidine kinase-like ATPase [Pholiota molesta]
MSTEPKPIRRLNENLINKIAAGEIIHRPASALKELIENSLDAGATSIRITVKDGGMKLLQIQDNGCGIRKSDMPILAERFTTSKLSNFSDLKRITTYGFRGEALASMSHVAHLSVVAKTKGDSCAWKAAYMDGVLIDPKTREKSEPRASAGNDGTTITYLRRISRILDVITKYAIHNPTVSFMCRKGGSPSPDISTPSSSDIPSSIRLLYGHSIAKELIHHELSADETEEWNAELYFTNANYQAKKMVFLLFINPLEAVYTNILPKGASPFVYLSLQIDPRSVDVNVHPTKRERIADAMQEGLVKQSHSRTFEYQVRRRGIMGDEPGPSKKRPRKEREGSGDEEEREEGAITSTTHVPMEVSTSESSQTPPTNTQAKSKEVKESACFLTSVRNLRQSLVKRKHRQLSEILEKHIFIGIVDIHKCLSLIQYSTKLYLVNHDALAEELFYQLGLRQFGDFSRIKLDPPPSLREMIEIAVEAENTDTTYYEHFLERRDMLADYFSLTITEDGLVESIPLLLRIIFLMRLGPQIECFDTFLRELAYFYIPVPPTSDTDEYKAERWQIQHVLFPAMRRYLLPPKSLLDRDVVQVADLPDLYKVFERC